MAAMNGILNFRDMSFYELCLFSDQQDRLRWRFTSVILSMLNNANASSKSSMRKPEDFDPYVQSDRLEAARRFRAENGGCTESLSDFIKRNQKY